MTCRGCNSTTMHVLRRLCGVMQQLPGAPRVGNPTTCLRLYPFSCHVQPAGLGPPEAAASPAAHGLRRMRTRRLVPAAHMGGRAGRRQYKEQARKGSQSPRCVALAPSHTHTGTVHTGANKPAAAPVPATSTHGSTDWSGPVWREPGGAAAPGVPGARPAGGGRAGALQRRLLRSSPHSDGLLLHHWQVCGPARGACATRWPPHSGRGGAAPPGEQRPPRHGWLLGLSLKAVALGVITATAATVCACAPHWGGGPQPLSSQQRARRAQRAVTASLATLHSPPLQQGSPARRNVGGSTSSPRLLWALASSCCRGMPSSLPDPSRAMHTLSRLSGV